MQLVKTRHHYIDPMTGDAVNTSSIPQHYWNTEDEAWEKENDPDAAYERHLEDRGWAEAEAHDRWEADNGVIQFSDALAQSMGYIDAEDRKRVEEKKAQWVRQNSQAAAGRKSLAPSPALRKWINFGRDPEEEK